MKSPTETSLHSAAQLWCLPAHSAKEMDTALAEDIAYAIDAAVKAERERCAGFATQWSKTDDLLLKCGEMTAQEIRTAKAVANGIAAAIRGGDNGG